MTMVISRLNAVVAEKQMIGNMPRRLSIIRFRQKLSMGIICGLLTSKIMICVIVIENDMYYLKGGVRPHKLRPT